MADVALSCVSAMWSASNTASYVRDWKRHAALLLAFPLCALEPASSNQEYVVIYHTWEFEYIFALNKINIIVLYAVWMLCGVYFFPLCIYL